MKTKKCIICGKEFQPRDRRRKTCSDECFRESCVQGRKKEDQIKERKYQKAKKRKFQTA